MSWILIFMFLSISVTTTTSQSMDLNLLACELLDTTKKPEFYEWLVSVRRKIHEYPELAFEEYKTSKVIRSELEKMGVEYKWPYVKTGLVASIGSGGTPFFGLRADMDAVPIQELAEPEFMSKLKGKMHACGHDAHVAMLLGAAKLLQTKSHQLKGTAKLLFQPGEETYGGAYYMLQEGALHNFEGIFGLHVWPGMPVGMVASRPGTMLAGAARFRVSIKGNGDPVVAASFAILALQQIVSRETDPLHATVVSVSFVEAGETTTVLPKMVTFGGTFRSMSLEGLYYLQQRIKEIVQTQADVHRCTASIDFLEEKQKLYPPTRNDREMYDLAKFAGENLVGEENVTMFPMVMGAEDFSFYTHEMKAAYFMIGSKGKNVNSGMSLHSPYFDIDEEVLPVGAAFHAAVAISYLNGSIPIL